MQQLFCTYLHCLYASLIQLFPPLLGDGMEKHIISAVSYVLI